MTIDSEADLRGLRRAGEVVRRTIAEMAAALRPGATPRELDELGGELLSSAGARSAPKLAYNFPGHTCISVNDVAAHGVPNDRPIREGDLVNIDVSAELDGYWADSGASFPVGAVGSAEAHLCRSAKRSLQDALRAVRAGRPINVIGRAVSARARRSGHALVSGLAGHGVGRFIHEEPSVLNHFSPWDRQPLREGLVITIEPFLTTGTGELEQDADGWTLRTKDGAPCAQYEHTLVVTRSEPIVVT